MSVARSGLGRPMNEAEGGKGRTCGLERVHADLVEQPVEDDAIRYNQIQSPGRATGRGGSTQMLMTATVNRHSRERDARLVFHDTDHNAHCLECPGRRAKRLAAALLRYIEVLEALLAGRHDVVGAVLSPFLVSSQQPHPRWVVCVGWCPPHRKGGVVRFNVDRVAIVLPRCDQTPSLSRWRRVELSEWMQIFFGMRARS